MNAKTQYARKVLGENQVVLLFVSGDRYNTTLLDFLKAAVKDYTKILYVALNRPASKIASEMAKRGLDTAKFHFIDAITEDAKICRKMDNCDSVSANELVELSVKIGEVISRVKPDIVLLDSFHLMLAYQDISVVTRLAHDIIAKIDISGCKGLFPIVAARKESTLARDLEMFVDEVAEI